MQLLPMLPDSRFHLLPARLSPADAALFFSNLRNYMGEDGSFMVMDTDAVVEAVSAWRAALPTVRPFYPLKTSADPVLLAVLSSLGTGFSAINMGEVESVLALKTATADDLLFTSPIKTRGALQKAALAGVTTLSFDSQPDLVRIRAAIPNAKLFLRFALPGDFGADPEIGAPQLLQTAASLGMSVHGLSFYASTPGEYRIGIAHAERLICLGRSLGHPLRTLDLGTGFCPSNLSLVASVIASAIRGLDMDVVAQPGCFLAANSATLVSNVIAKQDSTSGNGYSYHINEGVFGSFGGALLGETAPHAVAVGKDSHPLPSSVFGPSSDGLDQVIETTLLPELDEGDWLMFPGMGHRSIHLSAVLNGFPAPTTYHTGTLASWDLVRSGLSVEENAETEEEDEASSSSAYESSAESNFTDDCGFF